MLFNLFRRYIFYSYTCQATHARTNLQVVSFTRAPFFFRLCLSMQGHTSRQRRLILFPDDVDGTRDAKTTIRYSVASVENGTKSGGVSVWRVGASSGQIRSILFLSLFLSLSLSLSLGVWGTGFCRWNINTSGSPQPARTHTHTHAEATRSDRVIYTGNCEKNGPCARLESCHRAASFDALSGANGSHCETTFYHALFHDGRGAIENFLDTIVNPRDRSSTRVVRVDQRNLSVWAFPECPALFL